MALHPPATPTLPPAAALRGRRLPRRVSQLIVGLALYGFAISMMVRGAIGVAPWDVLTTGLVARTGLSFGALTNIIGVLVLLLWIPLRQRPGVGTLLNVLLIGPFAQLGLWLLPPVTALPVRIALLAGGILLLGIASGLYIAARLGPGPRDGLMTGLVGKTGWPVWIVRTGLEVIVVAAGWLLGGDVGVGTLAFALVIGPIVGVTMPLFRIGRL